MHARKQAILTRSDPIPSLQLGIDTSKRKKWQRSITQPTKSSQLPTTTWKRQRSFTCTHGNGTSPVSVSQPQLRALHGTSGVRSTVQAGHLTSRLPAANCCRMILKNVSQLHVEYGTAVESRSCSDQNTACNQNTELTVNSHIVSEVCLHTIDPRTAWLHSSPTV